MNELNPPDTIPAFTSHSQRTCPVSKRPSRRNKKQQTQGIPKEVSTFFSQRTQARYAHRLEIHPAPG